MEPSKKPKPHGRSKQKAEKPRKGRDPKRSAEWYCDGHNRAGDLCANRAGFGTDHLGQGKCKSHGGATPTVTGRYSSIKRPRIVELMAQFEKDANPHDLTQEVMLLRAIIVDAVERHDALNHALLAWHESYKKDGIDEGKPRQLPDLVKVAGLITDIGALVDKIQKQKQEGTISLATFNRVMEQLGIEVERAADEVLKDEPTRTAYLDSVQTRWSSIRF